MIVCGGLLCGDRVPLAKMPARRASYETYRALPYPALIRGRFERGCNAMTDPGVPHDDMLSFLWRSGMDVPHDRGPGEDAALPRPVADVLAALRAAPSHGELTGLDPVLTEPRRTALPLSRRWRSPPSLVIHRPASTRARARRHHDDEPKF